MPVDPRRLSCPRCSTPWVDPARDRCPSCGFRLSQSLVFPAAQRPLNSAPPILAGAATGTGEAECHVHPQRRASLACDECGRLICGLCDVPSGKRHLCPACFDSAQTRVDGDLPASRPMYGRIALALAIIPLFPPTALAALVVLAAGRGKPGSLVRPTRFHAHLAFVLACAQLTVVALLVAMVAADR